MLFYDKKKSEIKKLYQHTYNFLSVIHWSFACMYNKQTAFTNKNNTLKRNFEIRTANVVFDRPLQYYSKRSRHSPLYDKNIMTSSMLVAIIWHVFILQYKFLTGTLISKFNGLYRDVIIFMLWILDKQRGRILGGSTILIELFIDPCTSRVMAVYGYPSNTRQNDFGKISFICSHTYNNN